MSKIFLHWCRVMRQPDFCLGENNGADQLRSYCKADQRLCFCYKDSTISLLLKSKISKFYHLLWLHRPVYVGPVWKSRRLVFSRQGSLKLDTLTVQTLMRSLLVDQQTSFDRCYTAYYTIKTIILGMFLYERAIFSENGPKISCRIILLPVYFCLLQFVQFDFNFLM